MAYAATSSGAIVAARMAIANAIKASGAIIHLNPDDFVKILARTDKSVVVIAKGGFIKSNYQYLTAYKGLIFFTKSVTELMIPGDIEVITSQKIWIPA